MPNTSPPRHLMAHSPSWAPATKSAVASGCQGSASQAETQRLSLGPSVATAMAFEVAVAGERQRGRSEARPSQPASVP